MTRRRKWKNARRALTALASAGAALLALGFGAANAADAGRAVVIELFQSQGCSSCPPANANVSAIADRADVLALSFAVTYWDHLGWKDTFAKPEYTARQWDYAHGLGHPNVFTPQVVVNGRTDIVGVDRGELERTIAAAARPPNAPDLTIVGGAVSVGGGPAPKAGADVWLVRYDPRVIQVPIRRGENGGKTLAHKNIVRELVRLGAWSGAAARYPLPGSRDPALRTAILLQTVHGGVILAALKG